MITKRRVLIGLAVTEAALSVLAVWHAWKEA